MKAENLVNKEKLVRELDELMNTTDETGTHTLEEFIAKGREPKIRRDILLEHIKDCTLSPAELTKILKGDSWVLEELDSWLQCPFPHSTRITVQLVIKRIKKLQSQAPNRSGSGQAPVSGLAKQAEKNRWGVAWNKATRYLTQNQIKDILAQVEEEIPPRSKEEKR